MRYFGHALVAVAVVERFKQESMYRLSTGTKGVAHGELAVIIGGLTVFFCYVAIKNLS